jgi:hypothetical protein
LIVAHQSLSQARGSGNISDPLMVNTATKIIWTSFREDAAKFAGSMQIRPEEILNLPQFTFGMHSRKQGFGPIKGVPNALGDFLKRDDPQALRREMEDKYGAQANTDDVDDRPNDDPGDPPTDDRPDLPNNDNDPGTPPDVEII